MNNENDVKIVDNGRVVDADQHVDATGTTDAEKGATLGGLGGAVTGGIAGSMVGPVGTVVGAVIGGVVGAVASGAAVHQVDKHDDDTTVTGIGTAGRDTDDDLIVNTNMRRDNDLPGIQTGGHAVDGTPDTRGVTEKMADAVTGNKWDDKTGKPISGSDMRHDNNLTGNNMPGIQTGGHAVDGTPDTRGVTEKIADTVTGNKWDDKTGKPIAGSDMRHDNNLTGNNVPGVQTGGHAVDGTPDTRGVTEKIADAVTGDKWDDKTGKPVQ